MKLLSRALLYLFGTFMHELSHFAAAMVLGRPEGFSLWPRIEGDTFIFGEVRARVRYKVLGVFIAAAPLIWWLCLFFAGRHFLRAYCAAGTQWPEIGLFLLKMKTMSIPDVFFLWVGLQLLWAGRLSAQDIKTCLSGLVSPSGAMLVLSAALLWRFFG